MSDQAVENMHLRDQARTEGLAIVSPAPTTDPALRAENAELRDHIREKNLANAFDSQIAVTHQVLLPASQKFGGWIGRGLGSLLQGVSGRAAQRAEQRGRHGPIVLMRVGGVVMSVGLIGISLFCGVLVLLCLMVQFGLRIFTTRY